MPGINVAEVSYGSDKNGLIWAYLFAAGQPTREIDSESAAEWIGVNASANQAEFIWLHFSLSNTAAERWMRQTLHLPEAYYESLRESVGSTRLEQAGDALVAVIHDVLFDTANLDASSVSTVTLCVTPRLVVSARSETPAFARSPAGGSSRGPAAALNRGVTRAFAAGPSGSAGKYRAPVDQPGRCVRGHITGESHDGDSGGTECFASYFGAAAASARARTGCPVSSAQPAGSLGKRAGLSGIATSG